MMNNLKTAMYTFNNESRNFDFVTDISANDKAIFVRTVVGGLVDDANYDSVLRDIIFDYVVISMFTDIDISFLKAVDEDGNEITDIDLLEQFLEETNVIDIIKINASPTLFNELNVAVDKSIQYRTGIHPNPLNDALANLMNTLEKKIGEVDLDSMMEMVAKFSGMTEEFTPENIVNAYINSDVHKNNLNEIKEVKLRSDSI